MNFDLIWARITRIVSFWSGLAIMSYETIGDKSDRPWLYAAAIGMMGLPIARAAENVLGKIGGSGPQEVPTTLEQATSTDAETPQKSDR